MTNEWSHLTDEELQALIERTMAESIRPIFEGTTRNEVTTNLAQVLERMTGLEGNVETVFDGLDKTTGLATFSYIAKTPMGEAYIRGMVQGEALQAFDAPIH